MYKIVCTIIYYTINVFFYLPLKLFKFNTMTINKKKIENFNCLQIAQTEIKYFYIFYNVLCTIY